MDEVLYHYLDEAGEAAGPVTADAVRRGLADGTIPTTTSLWRDGWPDWRPISSVPEFAGGAASHPPTMPPTVSPVTGVRSPWGIPAMPPKFYDPGSFMTLYWSWVALYVVSTILIGIGGAIMTLEMMALESRNAPPDQLTDLFWAGLGTTCTGVTVLIPATIVLCFLLYRAWRQIQDGLAETGPGKAIGFYFIPLFNIYWMFVLYWGLAKDLNAYAARYGVEGVSPSASFVLGALITNLVASLLAGCLGIFGMPLTLIAAVLMIVMTYQLAAASRGVAEAGMRGVGYVGDEPATLGV